MKSDCSNHEGSTKDKILKMDYVLSVFDQDNYKFTEPINSEWAVASSDFIYLYHNDDR